MFDVLFITSATDFRHRAACRSAPGASPDEVREMAEKFYPVAKPGTVQYAVAVADAKAVCAGCPVRAECLEAALARPAKHDHHGVEGGLDPEERANLRRSQQAAAREMAHAS